MSRKTIKTISTCQYCGVPYSHGYIAKGTKYCSHDCSHAARIRDRSVNFDSSYIPEPNSGCWLWLEGTDDKGYGLVWIFGRGSVKAHRFSYELHTGPIPKGKFLLHSCDVPLCVNPDHLRPGTHKENMEDMVRRGRAAPTRDYQRKLSSVQALEIKNSNLPTSVLSERFGVQKGQIRRIRNGKCWGHLSASRPKEIIEQLIDR